MSCDNVNIGQGQLVTFGGVNLDAFGRLRVSEPFTLFDSQNRYAEDDQYSSSTVNGANEFDSIEDTEFEFKTERLLFGSY